jgi:hypothetical protein
MLAIPLGDFYMYRPANQPAIMALDFCQTTLDTPALNSFAVFIRGY